LNSDRGSELSSRPTRERERERDRGSDRGNEFQRPPTYATAHAAAYMDKNAAYLDIAGTAAVSSNSSRGTE